MRKSGKRKISLGTIAVLSMTLIILAATAMVWFRLSSGASVDLGNLSPVSLNLPVRTESPEDIRETVNPDKPSPQKTAAPATEPPPPEKKGKSFTMTAAGTVALEGEVRKNSYYSDVKQYDYYDIMMLLKKELQSDLNVVFLENLFTEDGKINDIAASGAGAAMLKAAGFNAAACGFSGAYEKGEAGIDSTSRLLEENGIRPLGLCREGNTESVPIIPLNGIRVAMLQYTDTISAATRKKMEKNGQENLIPAADPDAVAADIDRARKQGCEVVIVLLNWGRNGKAPDKNMRIKAQQIADAGADLIIGNGSRVVSGAEMLTAGDDKRQVLCIWSLGTTLSGNRNNISRIAGMMLQVTVRVEDGRVETPEACYIPLYTWKYRQDSRTYYRCLSANRAVPDGMDAEQQKMMKRAAETVQKTMKDSPLEEKKNE